MCFESRSTQDLLTDQFGIKGRIRVKNEPTVSSQNTWEDGAALRRLQSSSRGYVRGWVWVCSQCCVVEILSGHLSTCIWKLEEA